MKFRMIEAWRSLLKLMRFIIWYVIAVAAVFYALPIAGLFLEGKYDVMSDSAKLFSVLGFFAVVAVWQIASRYGRRHPSMQEE